MVHAGVRVLVTGGAGFIGSRVAAASVAAGNEVIVVDDLSTGSRAAVPAGAQFLVADVADPAIADLVRDLRPTVVIHAAAQVSVVRSVRDPGRDADVNVGGTRNVVDGAVRAEARRIVFFSSGGAIYGETTGATESDPALPKSPYGRNKLLAEGVVAGSGIGFGIARLSNVYGPGQRSDLEGGVVAIFTDAVAAGMPVTIYGDGQQRRDLIHVDDVTDAVLRISTSDLSGTWNVATGCAWSVVEVLEKIEARIGRSVARSWAPAREGDIRDSCLRIDQIARDLDWRPSLDLDGGLDRTVAATREAGRQHDRPGSETSP